MARSKYHAVRTQVDGITFASKREAARYGELALLLKIGEISDLQLQVGYDLKVNGVLICRYVADFTYHDVEFNRFVVEDVKGVKTPAYTLKKKLMKAIHGIDIFEVR